MYLRMKGDPTTPMSVAPLGSKLPAGTLVSNQRNCFGFKQRGIDIALELISE